MPNLRSQRRCFVPLHKSPSPLSSTKNFPQLQAFVTVTETQTPPENPNPCFDVSMPNRVSIHQKDTQHYRYTFNIAEEIFSNHLMCLLLNYLLRLFWTHRLHLLHLRVDDIIASFSFVAFNIQNQVCKTPQRNKNNTYLNCQWSQHIQRSSMGLVPSATSNGFAGLV